MSLKPRTRLHSEDGFYRQLLALCLLVLVGLCLPAPINHFTRFGFLLLTMLLAKGLGAPLPDGRSKRWHQIASIVYRSIAILTIVLLLIWTLRPDLLSYSAPLLIAFYIVFIAASISRLMRSLSREVNIDYRLLSGALAGYLLMGLSGGLLFVVLDSVIPGSFRDMVTGSPLVLQKTHINLPLNDFWTVDFGIFIYFSFVCLTTVGFGDIAPVVPISRFLSMALSVLGPLYIAVVLGLLISRLSVPPPSPPSS